MGSRDRDEASEGTGYPEGARSRLICALDVPSIAPALTLVEQTAEHVGWYKIGLQLFCAVGPSLIDAVRDRQADVFLDLKLHDIPNTVASTVKVIADSGVQMFTVHACGGARMVEAAAQVLAAQRNPPLMLAVTVLTSHDTRDLRAMSIHQDAAQRVDTLARLAIDAGADGLVCSAHEAGGLRRELGPDVALVCPGIRPKGSPADDQRRTMTPAEAIAAGASHIVVGRPIRGAASPELAARRIAREMNCG
jgi:orotidine-5'-phosphate decarboxylase